MKDYPKKDIPKPDYRHVLTEGNPIWGNQYDTPNGKLAVHIKSYEGRVYLVKSKYMGTHLTILEGHDVTSWVEESMRLYLRAELKELDSQK